MRKNVLFTQYAQSCIKVKARQLSRRSEFSRSDEGDLENDLWVSLLKKAECFDPDRSSAQHVHRPRRELLGGHDRACARDTGRSERRGGGRSHSKRTKIAAKRRCQEAAGPSTFPRPISPVAPARLGKTNLLRAWMRPPSIMRSA